MNNDFEVTIITPKGKVVEDRTSSLTLRSIQGEIGVLTQHCRYTGLLGKGPLQYTSTVNNEKKNFAVNGGFCTFSGDSLVILADETV